MHKKIAPFCFLIFLLYPALLLFSGQTLTVQNVIDGDTLQLSNGETVRLIGIDCEENEYSPAEATYTNTGKKFKRGPESIKKAKEAAEFTRKLVDGKQVRLEYDVQAKDKYGRTLAYVWYDIKCDEDIPEYLYYESMRKNANPERCSASILNATLIKAGYAQVMTPTLNPAGQVVSPNVKYQELFAKLEKEAKEKKRGLWK